MKAALPPIDPPAVYLREWMGVREFENQKLLAKAMGTTPGTISKKLKDPHKIDVEWLARFAAALQIRLVDLFVDPRTLPQVPPPARPLLEELLSAAADAGDDDLDALIRLARRSSAAPRPERASASQDRPLSKEPST